MAKLEITRQNIFASTNKDGDTFYYLILGTSTYGCIHIKIRNVPAFRNIIGLKIDNLGYACINNIQHTPWRKFNFRKTVNYRKLSDQEYSLITNAIHDYMNGNIGFANDNTMMYMDEIAKYNANLANKAEESFEDTIDGPSVVSSKPSRYESTEKKAGGVKENNEDIINDETLFESDNDIHEEPAIENDEAAINMEDSAEEVESEMVKEEIVEADSEEHAENVNEVISTELDSDNSIQNDESDKKSGIDLIPTENIEIEGPKEKGVKCYNLITTSSTSPYYMKSKEAARRSTTQLGRKVYRHIYTEEETFEIAHLENKCIMLKYKVSPTIAVHMRATAKKIYDIEVEERAKRKNYIELFDMGLSVEDVSKMTDSAIGTVKKSYNSYYTNKKAENGNVSCVIDKWTKAIKDNELDKILEVFDMTAIEFAKQENIATHHGVSILNTIREYVFKNPLIVIGVDKDMAFDNAKIKEYVESLRNAKDRWKEINNAKVWVIEKALSLKDAYVSSYDDHIDIMHGIKPVPDSVSKKDRDAFITMITNRFYLYRMGSSKRNLTADQRYIMDKNKEVSVGETMIAFMCVDNGKVKSIRVTAKKNGVKSNKAAAIEAAT